MSIHLKPEQFSDVLLGIANRDTASHVSACSQCRTEIEAMREVLEVFRTAAVGWSESAAKNVVLARKGGNSPVRIRPAWVLAAAAMVFAATVSFSVWRGHGSKTVPTSDTRAQISRDNQLLAHIELEVDEITPTPMQPLQIDSKVRVR